MILTLPTCLTLLRIGLLPVLVVVYYLPVAWAGPAAAVVFTIAGLTDWFDGYLARRLQQESRFGAFLDPVADKLMVATALVLVVETTASALMSVAAIIIIGREITISALREWMAEIGDRARVSVSWMGKAKTTAQMGALGCLLYGQPLWGLPVVQIGFVMLACAAVLTLWSMIDYLSAALSVDRLR